MSDRTYALLDDGTLDTVIQVTCELCENSWEERISLECAAEYRLDDGSFSGAGFDDLCLDYLDNEPCPYCEG